MMQQIKKKKESNMYGNIYNNQNSTLLYSSINQLFTDTLHSNDVLN
jgi:hypothetical protein